MEMVRCLFCGPFVLSGEEDAIDQLHRHLSSDSHQLLVALDAELNELHYLGET